MKESEHPIDWVETKKKLALFRQAAIARELKVSTALFCQVVNDEYEHMESEGARRIIARLEELHILVRKPSSREAA